MICVKNQLMLILSTVINDHQVQSSNNLNPCGKTCWNIIILDPKSATLPYNFYNFIIGIYSSMSTLAFVVVFSLISIASCYHQSILKRSLQMNERLNFKAIGKAFGIGLTGLVISSSTPIATHAKEAPPSLEKCFNAVRKELSPEGESLKRLTKDIESENWDDLKLFTREYDAGFRGYVMKNAWKQMDETERKKRGIEISNSFTFDLIALNKAARAKDSTDAYKRLEEVRKDLQDFLTLDATPASAP